jgi:hypothetical protein
MPSDISVMTDPGVVYGIIGVLIGAVLLALIFALPRRGLGAASKSDAAKKDLDGLPWMPGGDVFGHDKEPVPPPPEPPTDSPPYFDPNTDQPAAHDPWSTTDQSDQPRWDRP